MKTNLTPEKKERLKKAVLNSIDSPTGTMKPADRLKPSSLLKSGAKSAPARSAKPVFSPRPDPKPAQATQEGPIFTPQDKKGSWDDSFFSKSQFKQKKEFKFRPGRLIMIIVIAVIVVFAAYCAFDVYALYKLGWRDNFSVGLSSVLGLRAASVNGQAISLNDYYKDYDTLSYALENNREALGVDPHATDIKSMVMDRLVSIRLIRQQLDKYRKSVSSQDLDTAMNNLLSQFGSQDKAAQSVKQFYNMNLDQFKQNVVEPLLESDLLQSLIVNDNSLDINKQAEQRAEDVLALATKGGADFSELAKQYTDDPAGINTGGDLGYVSEGEMPADLEKALFALPEKTVYSQIVKNADGYHIFYVESKMKDKDTGKETLKLKQIFIKVDLNKYLSNLSASSTIKKYIN